MSLGKLHTHPLYATRTEFLGTDERITLVYQKAQLILQTWSNFIKSPIIQVAHNFDLDLTLNDIGRCTPRFWEQQSDPIFTLDPAVSSILACNVNLFLGTLAPLVKRRPYLQPIVEKALKGDIFGNFLLSELGHGLDIMSLETTATKSDGGFILHTPNSEAAKWAFYTLPHFHKLMSRRFMSPTTPIAGVPKFAIVLAKVMVHGEERGIHPFLIQTSDEHGMCQGISSTRLPPRNGGSPVDYALTVFHNVHIPDTAFLGSSLELPENWQLLLQSYLWRIPIGTALLSVYVSHAAKFVACIGADYSFRRHVQGRGSERIPIISFRTQQIPVLCATAVAYVLSAWRPRFVEYILSDDEDPRSRYGLSVVFKSTVNRLVAMVSRDIGERLGAQGLFGYNVVSQMEVSIMF